MSVYLLRSKGALALALLIPVASSSAAEVPPLTNVSQINNSDIVRQQALIPESVMGEQFDPRIGAVRFRQVDLTLKGKGPDIEVSRTFEVDRNLFGATPQWNGLADWVLEVPRMSTTALSRQGNNPWPNSSLHTLWQVNSGNPVNRCSEFNEPLHVPSVNWEEPFLPRYWWTGVSVDIPGAVPQKVLAVGADSALLGKTSQKLSTNGGWVISCLAGTKNGVAGEAFLATSPDGVKYWFDWMVQGSSSSVPEFNGLVPEGMAFPPIALTQAILFATRVEDRFGNFVEYKYQGRRLVESSSSDGRKATFNWSPDNDMYLQSVSYITDGTSRSVAYSYHMNKGYRTNLSRATYPDGSSMEIDLRNFYYVCNLPVPEIPGEPRYATSQCPEAETLTRYFKPVATMKAPSGLVAEYQLYVSPYYRSGTECVPGDDPNGGGGMYYSIDPCNLTVFQIVSKTYSGPGIPKSTWRYSYSTERASDGKRFDWALVTLPDGKQTASKFASTGISSALDGRLLSVYEGAVMSNGYPASYMRNTNYDYYVGKKFGTSLAPMTNRAADESPIAISRTTISEAGLTLKTEVKSFDEMSRPLQIVETSVP